MACQYDKTALNAIERLLRLPVPESSRDAGTEGTFDPWEIFPVYGTYAQEFDECAIAVLEDIRDGERRRDDLAADIFREFLCKMDLCDYGTSPRVCFPVPEFRLVLPSFIEKWKAYSAVSWDIEE